MTRDELLERICPNDASYDCSTGESGSCSKCDELLNKWLNEYDAKVRAEERAEIRSELMGEMAMLNETKMTVGDLKCFAYRIKAIVEQMYEQDIK